MTDDDRKNLTDDLGKAWSDFEEARNDRERRKVRTSLINWIRELDKAEGRQPQRLERQVPLNPTGEVTPCS